MRSSQANSTCRVPEPFIAKPSRQGDIPETIQGFHAYAFIPVFIVKPIFDFLPIFGSHGSPLQNTSTLYKGLPSRQNFQFGSFVE
jgi:hypothetical protein